MKAIEKKKLEYMAHRLKLSEKLAHYIYMEYEDSRTTETKQQIKELDEIIKILFKTDDMN